MLLFVVVVPDERFLVTNTLPRAPKLDRYVKDIKSPVALDKYSLE